jgi:5'-3' exonuclease
MSNKKDLLKLLNNMSENDINDDKVHDRVILIDGLNLFLRNFAMINFVNSSGSHIGGLGGFLRSLGSLINQIQPTSAYMIFDGIGSSTNRKNLLPEYKSGRNITRITNWDVFEDLGDENDAKVDQIRRLIHYLDCLPVKTISIDKAEADDVIAYYSDILPKKYGSKVYIVSSDKDFLQLINENVIVYRPTEKEFYNREMIKNKFGVLAENFILYKTLLGDNSDKIPGVKGLGEKGVFKKFPELQTTPMTLEDLFELSASKYKEHVVYSRIVMERDRLENTYKIMNLKRPLLSDIEKEFLEEVASEPTPALSIEEFLRYYGEDGLGHLIKNTEYWLNNTFKVLNSFNK